MLCVILLVSYFAQLNLLSYCYGKTKQSYAYCNSIPTRRSELQQRQESLEKRICEFEKGKKSNSSQSKTPYADKEESTTNS